MQISPNKRSAHSNVATSRSGGLMRWATLLAVAAAEIAQPVSAGDTDQWGKIYTSSNSAAGNEILILDRSPDGVLTLEGLVSTHGLGLGKGLGNQGALALSSDRHWLFAVNAGSNEISTFNVASGRPVWVANVASGGIEPISLTVHDTALFVLNAGGTNNIAGFRIGNSGQLTAVSDWSKHLSAPSVGPAEIAFSASGEIIVVTEKATNNIDTFLLDDGALQGPFVHASSGATPFGFAFDFRGHLIVSEAFGGAAGASAVSSYIVSDDSGAMHTVSPSVGDRQSAACWIAITNNSKYAYAANTGSGSISGYRVDDAGRLSLLDGDGKTGVIGAGSGPTDEALTPGNRYLYTLAPPIGSVAGFRVGAAGSLSSIGLTGGLPTTATGLIAR